MSVISNEWVNLEMREGIFKDKSPRSGRPLFFLCVFVFLFLWSIPTHSIVSVDKNTAVSNEVQIETTITPILEKL